MRTFLRLSSSRSTTVAVTRITTATRAASTLAAATLAALAACADQGPTAPTNPPAASRSDAAAAQPAGDVIPGRFIVVFRGAGSGAGGLAGGGALTTVEAASQAAAVDAKISATAAKVAARVRHRYAYALRGFAADLSDTAVAELRADPEVAYVEPDRVMRISTTQSNPPWGLDRIDERALPLSGSYTYTSTGRGVRAYIIDTGIQTSHPQFGGRASAVYDAVGDGQNGQDCNGHGTHVAGTVGASTYGVAKGAYLRAVRVLDCSGSGSNSGVIAGINWVAQNHIAPAVANMSLGGGASQAVDDAVNTLASSGVFVAVAAGNENQDACNTSPARAANTTTVAASTVSDAKASYSNFGGCVDLYAPGSSITSTWIGSATNTISGTSMATPHVTGVAALYKAANGDASYTTIRGWLRSNATADVITGNPGGTANRLLYKAGL